ncbi:hypothetical protein [Blastococcus sp. CCUG 61487]|uniref:hypothetical protein n=1 Tax=Blastococcus sp. CCUG 61487 TaxID=1840703 RepID=UPI0010C141C4|nr:hypothetical protein [Blastococcus sp. CCUG 61487]
MPTAVGDGTGEDAGRSRRRLSLPLVPVLAVLLVLLVGAVVYLWATRQEDSAVSTGDYAAALQAARSGVVDIATFDHLTLDDDLEQIRRVTTGDFTEQAVAELEAGRERITEYQVVANTEVIGAGVTQADEETATVMLLIQATSQNAVDPRPTIEKSRIQVTLEKVDDRWLLTGISGR